MDKIIQVGSIITDKRILYKFKRKGFIWSYSQWGYLEDLRIRTKNDLDFSLYVSNQCKVAEKFEGAMWEKYRQLQAKTEMTYEECYELFGNDKFTYEGMVFATKYVDGCFNPYLIRIE